MVRHLSSGEVLLLLLLRERVMGETIVVAHSHEAVDDVDGHREYYCGVVLRRDAVESLEISELEIINKLDQGI